MPVAEPRPDEAVPIPMSPRRDHSFASASLAMHLRRGLIGFGAVALAWFLRRDERHCQQLASSSPTG
jgi:hypothetical protein